MTPIDVFAFCSFGSVISLTMHSFDMKFFLSRSTSLSSRGPQAIQFGRLTAHELSLELNGVPKPRKRI
jgi:hypothetical protein